MIHEQFKVGDRVMMSDRGGGWTDGVTGTITALDVDSTDGIRGHRIDVPGVGYTVVPEFQLTRV